MPPKVKPNSPATKQASTTNVDTSPDISVYFQQLQKSIEDSAKSIRNDLDNKFNTLMQNIGENKAAINLVSITANQANAQSNDNAASLAELQTRVTKLEEEKKTMSDTQDTQAVQIATLQSRLEDQTCRNARKSLIIRGIAKTNDDEKWHETRTAVCEAFNKAFGLEKKEVNNMIERIHRGMTSDDDTRARDGKATQSSTIHAQFYDWNDCERILKLARANSKKSKIYIDQRYGPDTTWRRNQALLKRKELLETGAIYSGFVQYPARLLVKLDDRKETKYTLHQNFSTIKVPLDIRR